MLCRLSNALFCVAYFLFCFLENNHYRTDHHYNLYHHQIHHQTPPRRQEHLHDVGDGLHLGGARLHLHHHRARKVWLWQYSDGSIYYNGDNDHQTSVCWELEENAGASSPDSGGNILLFSMVVVCMLCFLLLLFVVVFLLCFLVFIVCLLCLIFIFSFLGSTKTGGHPKENKRDCRFAWILKKRK